MLADLGDKYIKSGKHYFEVKLDKLPKNPDHLKIGINCSSGKKWIFTPLRRLKEVFEGDNCIESESYGVPLKQGDSLGILLKIDKSKTMRVIFYRNCTGLGLCWKAKVAEINFSFGLGSEGEISLDTRVQPPLDSYRF